MLATYPVRADSVLTFRVAATLTQTVPLINFLAFIDADDVVEVHNVSRLMTRPEIVGGTLTDLVVELLDEKDAVIAGASAYHLPLEGSVQDVLVPGQRQELARVLPKNSYHTLSSRHPFIYRIPAFLPLDRVASDCVRQDYTLFSDFYAKNTARKSTKNAPYLVPVQKEKRTLF